MQVGGRRREVTFRGCRRLGLNEGLLFLFKRAGLFVKLPRTALESL